MKEQPPRDSRRAILASGQRMIARKGYAAVGLSELLADAGVPKGSFYHWFASKDAFGEQMIDGFYGSYVADVDALCDRAELSGAARLREFFEQWRSAELDVDSAFHCMTTKLGSEVAETHPMLRAALERGGAAVLERLVRLIGSALEDGSARWEGEPRHAAEILFDIWVGAGVRARVTEGAGPLDTALTTTIELLHLDHDAVRPTDGSPALTGR